MFGFFKKKKNKDDDLVRSLMHAYVQGEDRRAIEQAIGTLGKKCLPSSDRMQFTVDASCQIVRTILEYRGANIKLLDDDDIFTSGVFLFTICNHISLRMGVQFETAAFVAPIGLFAQFKSPEEIENYTRAIADTYNSLVRTGKSTEAIGQNLIKWISKPSKENFDTLVKIYEIIHQHLK